MSNIQDYFKYILKNPREDIDNPSIQKYINKIKNGFKFKMKNGYYLEFLTP